MFIRKFLILLIFSFFSLRGNTANYQGVVSNISTFNGRVSVVLTNGSFDGQPSTCQTSVYGTVYWFDPSTAIGKANLAIFLSAKLSGKIVYVIGDSVCSSGFIYSSSTTGEGVAGVDFKG